jgi:type II secretory pathway component GspD/PulD (secretin)
MTKTILFLFALMLITTAFAQAKLLGINIEHETKGIRITIKGEGLGTPKQQWVNGTTVFILEWPAMLEQKNKQTNINKHGVKWVKVVQFSNKPPRARVALAITNNTKPKLTKNQNGQWVIEIGHVAPLSGIEVINAVSEADREAFENALEQLTQSTMKVETVSTSATINDGPAKKKTSSPTPPKPLAPVVETKPAYLPPDAGKVSLDFVGAEIVFILKALAQQTGSNIVSSPDVNGTLTVSLKNVSVTEALDLITKLAGYRYTKRNNTYIVGTATFLSGLLLHDMGSPPESVMRVVPLASRKAGEIKRAIMKALSIDLINENLKIVHPSEPIDDVSIMSPQQPTSGAPQNLNLGDPQNTNGDEDAKSKPAAGGPPKPAGGVGQTSNSDADYLILIGDKAKVDQALMLITQLDRSLAEMMGIASSETMTQISVPYRVRGAKADDLAVALQNVVSGVTLVATPKTSRAGQTIIVNGRANDVAKVIEMLEQLDNISADGELTFHIYQVKYADPRALKDRLEETFEALSVALAPQDVSGRSYKAPTTGQGNQQGTQTTGGSSGQDGVAPAGGGMSGGVQGISGVPIYSNTEKDAVPMKLILSGSAQQINYALAFLAKIDVAVPQIAIEARVMDVSKEELQKYGIDWDIITGGALRPLRFLNGQPGGGNNTVGGHIRINKDGGGQITADVTATLDKIATKNNLIARPNVVATDGREAVIFIGDVVRYIKTIQSSQNGVSVEVGEEEVGVKLNVLPRVGENNAITLEVQPVVSFIKSFLDVPGGGQIPTTSVRTARSALRIANGETIAIGGLITEEDRREVSGVPILMDLPLIGKLFRRTTLSKNKTEVVIFLTARVIEGEIGASKQEP